VTRTLIIGLGGGIGTIARYLLGGWMQRLFGSAFPYGTIAINAVGSFLIMVVMHAGVSKGEISADARLFLTTGILGGFTTYSTFNHETIRFFMDRSPILASVNLSATVVSCLVAGALGVVTARWLFGS
jgi:CrcB protein